MEYSGMGYVDAIKELAQNVGMIVPEADDRLPPAKRAEAAGEKPGLVRGNDDAPPTSTSQQLRKAPQAIAYLQKARPDRRNRRPLCHGLCAERLGQPARRVPDYDATGAGGVRPGDRQGDGRGQAVRIKRYDRFRDRIMFPIRNTKGQVIAFGGRVMDSGEPKYLNSPETPLFQKGSELYGLFEARQAIREAGYVLVTEGYMDVVALAQLGFPQAVATLGTACTTGPRAETDAPDRPCRVQLSMATGRPQAPPGARWKPACRMRATARP
jgi:DNA primase